MRKILKNNKIKKTTILLATILLVCFNLNAQNTKPKKNRPKIEIYDLKGNYQTGYLYYSTDSTLYLSDFAQDSIIGYNASNIYRLDYFHNSNYWRTTGITFGIMQGINLAVGATLTNEYFPENLIIGQLIVIPVTATAGIISFFQKKDFELQIEGDINNYQKVYPIIKKSNKLARPNIDSLISIYPIKEPNNEAISKIPETNRKKGFDAQSLFHIGIGIAQYTNFNNNQFSDIANSNNFDILKKEINNTSLNFVIGIKIIPNLRINYESYSPRNTTVITTYSNPIENVESFNIDLFYDISQKNLYFQYIFNPAKKILTNRHVFSVVAGISSLNTYFGIFNRNLLKRFYVLQGLAQYFPYFVATDYK